MKIYINRLTVNGPWGGGNQFVKACYKHMIPEEKEGEEPPRVVLNPKDPAANPDVFLAVGLSSEDGLASIERMIQFKLFHKPECKIVLRVNENDARKNTSNVDNMLVKISEYVDGTVFVSDWLRDYFKDKGWKCPNNTVIINGVNKEVFKPGEKLNDGNVNIVTHHWSNNYLKGFDIYDKIDEFIGLHPGFAFTYIGRDRGTFSSQTKVVRPKYGKALGEELGKHDVYVSASRFDPGPNHITEALACGLPTYVYKDGGGCIEFAGKDHVYSSWEELQELLLKKKFEANDSAIELNDWQSCIEEYIDFLGDVCNDSKA